MHHTEVSTSPAVELSAQRDAGMANPVKLPPSDQTQHRLARYAAPLFWVVIAFVWLLPIGSRVLISPDEGRYATLALHILQSGDWITPRLNGFLYFEKPPLAYWMGALAFHFFGVNEFAARLWPALAGMGCIALMGWAAGAWWGRAAALRAMAFTASMTWLVGNSHLLTLDTSLTFGLSLALAGLLTAFAPGVAERARRVRMCLAWVGMALATLSKGPIGVVIPAAALVLYSLYVGVQGKNGERDDERVGERPALKALSVFWRQLEWVRGGLIYTVLTVPWFVVVSMRNPGFAEFFFVHEHLMRYATKVHHRTGNLGYFIPFLLVGALPWLTMLGARAWQAWSQRQAPQAASEAGALLRPQALLWCWVGFVFVFFSLSGSKLPSYILPMFPALGLLAAQPQGLDALRWARHLALPLLIWSVLPVLWWAQPMIPVLARNDDTPEHVFHHLLGLGSTGALVFALGALVALVLFKRARRDAAIVTLALAHVIAIQVFAHGYDAYAQLRSARIYAPQIAAAVPADAPVYSVRVYDQSLPFYLGRNVVLVDYVDEFALGDTLEPGRVIHDFDAFMVRWRADHAAAALMAPETYDTLKDKGLPMHILYRDERRVVVSRSAS